MSHNQPRRVVRRTTVLHPASSPEEPQEDALPAQPGAALPSISPRTATEIEASLERMRQRALQTDYYEVSIAARVPSYLARQVELAAYRRTRNRPRGRVTQQEVIAEALALWAAIVPLPPDVEVEDF